MKQRIKSITSLLLCLILCLALLPAPEARATDYSASSALSYAANNVDSYSGLCASFVSACLRAGGLSDINHSVTGALFNTLVGKGYTSEVLNGYISYTSYDSGTGQHTGWTSTVTVSNNSGKVKQGDILFYVKYEWKDDTTFGTESGTHYIYHTVICSGTSGNNYICYGVNPRMKNANVGSYSSGLSGGDKIAVIVVHMNGSTTPVNPTVTVQPNTNSNHPMTINDTNAVISHFVYISGASISSLSKLGIKLYSNSGTFLESAYDTNIIDSGGYVDAWYSVGSGKEVDYGLTPGTTYKYRFFIEVGGETYYSDYKSFKTTGTTPTYTVTYNANGGTGAPASQTKTHGVDLTLSSTTPTRSNASAGSYTVTLNANGGSCSTSSLSAARTTTYTFKNWNTKADGTGVTYTPGQVYSYDGSLGLYAQWNSSTTTAAVTLPTPTRTGYNFKGWATNSSAASGVTGSYTPTGNVTLYAIWKPLTYTITYDANGGTGAPANQTKTYGVDLTLSTTKPTRANASAGSYTVILNANGGNCGTTSLGAARTTKYTFKNWNTKADGSGAAFNPGDIYTHNTPNTLYAQWNSSTTTAAVTLPTPTRTGFVFKGWATSSTDTSGVTGNYTPTGNVTLYAIWKENTLPISITANPKDQTVAVGKRATFTVTAQGSGLTYQWFVQYKGSEGWYPINGATEPALSFTVDASQNGRKYRCRVSNAGSEATSAEATLTVVTTPKITTQPKNASVKAGKKVTFKVKAAGEGLKYQWYRLKPGAKKWEKIKKATKASYSFKAAKKWNGYKFRCVVSNAAGKVTSKSVKLKVKK